MTLAPERVSQTFTMVLAAALEGRRCPENYELPVMLGITELCRQGRVKVYISGNNYRQLEILEGPHTGAKTAPNPKGHRVWKIIGKITTKPNYQSSHP